MIIGNVRADQKNDLCLLQVFVGSGWPVAAERALVTRNRASHAQCRISIVVLGGEAKLHQLTKGIELFSHKLAGADHAERILTVTFLGCAKLLDRHIESLLPTHSFQLAVLAEERMLRAIRSLNRVMLGKSLGAKLAKIDGMIGIPAHAHGAAILHADKHSAANRAVTTGGRDPAVRDFLRGGVPMVRIGSVCVFLRKDVESELALQIHAASILLATQEAAIFFGTTLT